MFASAIHQRELRNVQLRRVVWSATEREAGAMTTEAEDLETYKAAQIAEQIRCWQLCRAYVGMSQVELKHSGHKSQADAVLYTVKDSVKRCNKLWADFLKKWPDK